MCLPELTLILLSCWEGVGINFQSRSNTINESILTVWEMSVCQASGSRISVNFQREESIFDKKTIPRIF